MKKIKISELPLYNSLKGLFTIGTDKDNRSVKVSLEFIGEQTAEAVSNADTATKAAIKAKQDADTASQKANDATTAANKAAGQAETARKATETATYNANVATTAAQNAKKYADEATVKAKEATLSANQATENANQATENANKAITAAEKATFAAVSAADKATKFLERLVPTSLDIKPIPRLTIGNVSQVCINTVLTPENVVKNLIFISDNRAVSVSPDGRITIVGLGRSTVQVIPTLNTALAKVVQIEVGMPTARLVTTRKQLRFTQSGCMRLS